MDHSAYRVLKIDRNEHRELELADDRTVYGPNEIRNVVCKWSESVHILIFVKDWPLMAESICKTPRQAENKVFYFFVQDHIRCLFLFDESFSLELEYLDAL